MPWKGEKDPYRIWLSEVILQQTRVEQGTAYYNKFIECYPTIQLLAAATDEEVFKLWEGLGYYSRCRNLLHSARYVSNELGGGFPVNYSDLLQLKGIGSYTAAAIASFAYNLPHAVVDGNVNRILSRVFGLDTPIDSTEGKKVFNSLAANLLDKGQSAIYNQAIMDFGATVCKPRRPLCNVCPIQTHCDAYLTGRVETLPVKGKKLIKKQRWLNYVLAEVDNKIYVRKRLSKDIWESLYEFILIESVAALNIEQLQDQPFFSKHLRGKVKIISISSLQKQVLTHQLIGGYFIHVKLNIPVELPGYKALPVQDIESLAFPGYINNYLHSALSFTGIKR